MENHFGFCALKSPQTRMNIDKNRVDTLDNYLYFLVITAHNFF